MDSSFITKFVNQFLCYLTFTCLRRLTYNNHQLGETPKILPEFWYIHSSPLSKLLVIQKICSLLIIYHFDIAKFCKIRSWFGISGITICNRSKKWTNRSIFNLVTLSIKIFASWIFLISNFLPKLYTLGLFSLYQF